MKTQVIIPAAGVGARLKSSVVKPLVQLNGKPLIAHALEVFENCPLVTSVIIAVHELNLGDFDRIIKEHRLSKVTKIIPGGATRCESVAGGLKFLDKDTGCVLIHDGARPLISLPVIEQAIKVCQEESAVIVAVPVKPTIKRVNSQVLFVEETLDRRSLWEVQTPQVFKRELILKAHQKNKDIQASDDATLVERLGVKVKVVRGEYRNIKITTPEDLAFAGQLLKQKPLSKVKS